MHTSVSAAGRQAAHLPWELTLAPPVPGDPRILLRHQPQPEGWPLPARGLELRPIVGYRGEDWLFAFNPILNTDLSSNVDRKAQFEPALKFSRRVAGDTHAGIEYYGEYGPARHFVPAAQRAHYLYGTVDFTRGDWAVNLGIGRGFVAADDKWIVKAIVAFPFD